MKPFILSLLVTFAAVCASAQNAVVTTISNLLIRPVGRVPISADVLAFDDGSPFIGPKRWVWNPTNDLDTNSVWNGKVLMRSSTTNALGSVGRWELPWDGDVTALGAKGDNATDNTAVYAWAIKLAKSMPGGYTLKFPAGSFIGYIDLPYRVNIKGANEGRFSEFTALSSLAQTYVAGLTQLRLPNGANRPLILITNDGSGYVRQVDKVWGDGSVYTSVYGGNAISDVILNGNAGNQTSGNADLIRVVGFWGVTVENVGLFNNRGRPIRALALNACRVNKIFGFGAAIPNPSPGILIGTAADCIFSEWWVGGYDGPVLWIRDQSHWKNQYSDLMLFNSGSAGSQTNQWVSSVDTGTDIITTTGAHFLETGDPVEFWTTNGVLPAAIVSTNTYHAVRLSSTTFQIARAYTHAVAGTNLVNFTDAGSGTWYSWIGPMSGFYASDQARRNTFTNIRVDQNYGDGFVFNNAHRNVFSSTFAGENDFNNSANSSYGIRFTGKSIGNTFSGFVVYTTPGGVQFQDDSQENSVLAAAIDTDVTTRWSVADENDKNFYQEARSLWIGDYARVGNSNQTVAFEVVGNASGIRPFRIARPSAGATNSIGAALNQFILYNEVGANQGRIALFDGQTNYAELSFTKSLGANDPARVTVVRGGAASGENKDGSTLRFIAPAGTGSGVGGKIDFQTPVTGASGSTAQSLVTRLTIEQEGNVTMSPLASAPTLITTNSFFHGVIAGVTNWYFWRNGAWVGLP